MRRIFYFAVIGFWVVMTWLLVRSEFGEIHTAGVPIPPELVWQKVLQATDPSMVAVTYHGLTNRIGSFKLIPTVVEAVLPPSPDGSEELPEGMAHAIESYTLDFDGSLFVFLDGVTNRLRTSLHVKADTNSVWQEIYLQVNMRPETWSVEINASNQTVKIHSEGSSPPEDHLYTFKELSNPQRLLKQFGGLMMPELLLAFGAGGGNSLGVHLEARKDHRLQFGGQRIRCLRLQATVLGAYTASLYVNPQSGEIIRLDLPNMISLVNESFM